ncbi:UDP-glucose/GDP-mannose dehydrogenase family protein [candidate division KSB1 bacterium]|nr:UDP-glucose/GDP-mannose dehydrogenase family protein [candidate division KSB1 bacterium]NIR72171.1 UDP-glucose/GDP-mannose dehydrogenase family protein [candidate division KSB1 bacterium]NIS26636.1 UDP-glucose/GDP-mannose dehydrogenase family protein [candidate division KSB1 bacterium]NIT73404.1 UDP-glucose/GDP-mannose dehydrogenase family protein [candidate division KSB1 bacterium]NIU27252.1 UDP-glucose/GDP-mannose dehydrogenase family protein [candidate division KSB1 bacterium]
MHISVIGTGYVGLVTGTCFAEFGNDVICVDNDESKINKLKKGVLSIYEPGLDDLVAKNVKEGRLTFTTDIRTAVENSLVIFIAVGTPPKDDGSADLSFVLDVGKEIAKYLNGYKVIVNKSTVPVGFGNSLQKSLEEILGQRGKFSVASNPEFLREGSAIEDFMRPNRVVIGTESSEAIAIMKELYSPLYLIETPFVITNLESAELIKYASNAFLATKISFINEIANFCDVIGADVHHVALGMGLDYRIGKKFLHPGPGYGGSCFPKDTNALIQLGCQKDFGFQILESVVKVNNEQRNVMVRKIKSVIGTLEDKTLGILGLSFKPNTDDLREAPSLVIIEALLKDGAIIKAFDPVAMDSARKIFPNITYCDDTYKAAENCDALIFITEWNQFRSLDLDKIKQGMKSPTIIDLRNIYNPTKMRQKGFNYTCVGRPIIEDKDEYQK